MGNGTGLHLGGGALRLETVAIEIVAIEATEETEVTEETEDQTEETEDQTEDQTEEIEMTEEIVETEGIEETEEGANHQPMTQTWARLVLSKTRAQAGMKHGRRRSTLRRVVLITWAVGASCQSAALRVIQRTTPRR